MDAIDLELFERSLRHATEQHDGAELGAALAELGWADALTDDPQAAVSLLFELQGAATATSSALDQVLLHAIGLDADADTVVLLPEPDSTLPPGVLDGRSVSVTGIGSRRAETAIVPAQHGDEVVAVTVPLEDLEVCIIDGVDPSLGLVLLDGVVQVRTWTTVPWDAAVSAAQVAIGHELVGVSRTMLTQAREHALERVQFGQPISRFQAVRHRLADTLIAIEIAEAVLDAAWLDGSPATAAMAKALAGRGARIAARHCQQVLAGIGFTTEHPLHRSIRRTLVLDELFGSARTLTRTLGDDLLATRTLPPLLPL